jgi:hypothetical protein
MKMRSRFGRNRRGAGKWRRATSPEARPRVIFAPEVLMIFSLPHAAFRDDVLGCLGREGVMTVELRHPLQCAVTASA